MNDTIYTDLSTKNGQTYGDVFIDGGTGYDKLILEGNNDIDLSVIKDKISIKNIEEIDLTQGDHTLKNLKLDDVIDLTDGKNELYVKGNLGDKVELDFVHNKTDDYIAIFLKEQNDFLYIPDVSSIDNLPALKRRGFPL